MLSLTLDCQKIFIGSALELIKKNISKEYRVLIGGVVEVESLIPEHILSHNRNSTFGCNSRIEYGRVTKKYFVCIISPSLTTACKETLSFPLLKVREFTSKVTQGWYRAKPASRPGLTDLQAYSLSCSVTLFHFIF